VAEKGAKARNVAVEVQRAESLCASEPPRDVVHHQHGDGAFERIQKKGGGRETLAARTQNVSGANVP